MWAVKQWATDHGVRVAVRQTRPALTDPTAPWVLTVGATTTPLPSRNEREAWRDAWTHLQTLDAPARIGEQLTLLEAA